MQAGVVFGMRKLENGKEQIYTNPCLNPYETERCIVDFGNSIA